MSSSDSWWSERTRSQRVLVGVLAAIAVVAIVRQSIGTIAGSTPGGPVSSSYSTGGSGLEGYADLLRADGRDVTRLRTAPTAADLPRDATAVVADPDQLRPASAQALARFVAEGGQLVLTGEASAPFLAALTGTSVDIGFDGSDDMTVWVPSADTGAAREVVGDSGARWSSTGGLLGLAGDGSGPVLVSAPVGEGRVVVVADTSILQNRNLAEADNAALGLGLAGDRDRPVVFVESVHGFDASGTGGLPDSWKPAFAALVLAVVVGLWAFGRRFGPPEPAERELRPPRRDHVEAVASTLDSVGADTLPTHDRSQGGPP